MSHRRTALAACLLSVVLGAAFAARPRVAAVPEITIGAVLSASGADAAMGRSAREGYDLWADDVNRRGGLFLAGHAYRVTMLYRDDESNPLLTAQLAERLVNEEHARMLLGPSSADAVSAEAAVAERKAVPFVESAGSTDKLFAQGYRYTFGVTPSARRSLIPLVEIAAGLRPRPRTIAVVSSRDDAALEAAQGAAAAAVAAGMRVVLQDDDEADPREFYERARLVKAVHPDVVLMAAPGSAELSLARGLQAEHVVSRVVGIADLDHDTAMHSALHALMPHALTSRVWISPWQDPRRRTVSAARNYAHAFRHRYDHAPDAQSAAASADGAVLALAIEKANSTDADAVRRQLLALATSTFFGPVRFSNAGENTAHPYQVDGQNLPSVPPHGVIRPRPTVQKPAHKH